MGGKRLENELGDYLTLSQVELLKKTLQVSPKSRVDDDDSNSNSPTSVNSRAIKNGFCPELKLQHAFTGMLFQGNPDAEFINELYQTHDVYTGNCRDVMKRGKFYEVDAKDDTKITLFADEFRIAVWNRKATLIQSAWRGMQTRRLLVISAQNGAFSY